MALTARPRGWKWRARWAGVLPLHTLSRRFTLPITLRVSALITVSVSWPLLATKMRRPSGELTMFHGSAPVVMVPPTPTVRSGAATKLAGLALVILITVTLLLAALAT